MNINAYEVDEQYSGSLGHRPQEFLSVYSVIVPSNKSEYELLYPLKQQLLIKDQVLFKYIIFPQHIGSINTDSDISNINLVIVRAEPTAL